MAHFVSLIFVLFLKETLILVLKKKKKNHLKIGIEYFVKLKPKVVNVSTA